MDKHSRRGFFGRLAGLLAVATELDKIATPSEPLITTEGICDEYRHQLEASALSRWKLSPCGDFYESTEILPGHIYRKVVTHHDVLMVQQNTRAAGLEPRLLCDELLDDIYDNLGSWRHPFARLVLDDHEEHLRAHQEFWELTQ